MLSGFIWLRMSQNMGYCEHGNEPSSSINEGEQQSASQGPYSMELNKQRQMVGRLYNEL
jgi:hypothetical protein